MRIRIVTIFPELFAPFLRTSLVGRAVERGLLDIELHDLRDHTEDRHRSVDDEPYGGGGGMVMTAPPWIRAVRAVAGGGLRILLSPQGRRLDEERVRRLADRGDLVLLCGRYEGIDERVRQTVVDEEISIGDYVLSGGEVAAMVIVETVSRQVPGVVRQATSVERDSFRRDPPAGDSRPDAGRPDAGRPDAGRPDAARGLLDYPHYTRPRVVEGLEVPPALLSGHHAEIETWRRRQALAATLEKRPDLLTATVWEGAELAELEAVAKELGASLPPGLHIRR